VSGYLLRRLLQFLPIAFLATTVVFALLHLVPGDPAAMMLGEGAQGADVAALRARLGLDQPLAAQYAHYLVGLAHGDLGRSLLSGEPIADLLAAHFPATALLAAAALGLALLIALPLGILAALRQDTALDHGARALALVGVSLPSFWLGPLLVLLFAIGLGWLPVAGRQGLASAILPALTLGAGMAGLLTRMVRSAIAVELGRPYLTAARAKGLTVRRVLIVHVLRNALLPVVTVVGLQFGSLLTGSIITESIFSWPGLGRLLVQGIRLRDYPLVQACVLVIVLTYLVVNLVTDLLAASLDPRVREGLLTERSS
jgi:peptide/nickel transport system permease protein